jgi:hypothetical protein
LAAQEETYMMRSEVVCLVCALLAACCGFGQAPKGDSMEQAEKDYAAALAKAREEYNVAVTKAHEMHKLRLAELLAAEAKAGRVSPALADEIKKLDADGPQVLVGEDLNPKDKKQAKYVGVWFIRYSPDTTRTYTIKNDGDVTFMDEKKAAKLDLKGSTLNFGDGKVERLTFVGARVFVEHFANINDLDRKYPTAVGIGTRKR